MQKQTVLRLQLIRLRSQRSIGSFRKEHDTLKSLVRHAAWGKVQGGLIHFDGGALFHKEYTGILHTVGIVPDLPAVAQCQHEIRHCNVDLAALVIFKTVVGGVASVTVADFYFHAAVQTVLHLRFDRICLQSRLGGMVNISALRDSRAALHV